MDWKRTLATVAPALATALGGPLAGMAVKVATDALGVESSESALSELVLSGNPDALLKLKAAEHTFKIELKRLGIELAKIDQEDRESARELSKVNMIPQIILSTLYTLGYFVVMYQFVTGDIVIQPESTTAFNILLGVLTAAQTQIMNFFFGSSSGSKEKDYLNKAGS